jgi:N-acylneuraminate cytidylyltransferase
VSAGAIRRAYEQMQSTQADYCFTATSFVFPIQRAIKITAENRIEMFYPEHLETRSQDLEESYHDAGQFYWGKAETFKQQKPLFSKSATSYILPRHLVQDIDTPEDWKRAELMYQVLMKNGELD